MKNLKPFKDHEVDLYVDFVNHKVHEFIQEHSCIGLGPQYGVLSHDEVQNDLVLYRMHNHFEKPDNSNASNRKRKSLLAALKYDYHGLSHFQPGSDTSISVFSRKCLYEVRSNIITDLRDFRIDWCALPTSGETFISARGDTSILAKLRDKEQWCVTPDCSLYFSKIAYANRWIKKCAKQHINDSCGGMTNVFRSLLEKARSGEDVPDFVKDFINSNNKKNLGFNVFHYCLRKYVYTYVQGARFTTVPKGVEADRVIECEAMCNMFVQRAIEASLRTKIKDTFDIDLETSQEVHKLMISDLSNATIDLKNASNSVFMCVIKWLFPKNVYDMICRTRSGTISVPGVIDHYGLNMVAPMGNGYTFGLMTYILLHFARYFDSFAHVYGDDIIIDQDVAYDLIDVLGHIGFMTNDKKTFIDGAFRESCGAFTYNGLPLVSFKLEWASDICEAIINVNKLNVLRRVVTGKLQTDLDELWHTLKGCSPALSLCSEPTLFSSNATSVSDIWNHMSSLKQMLQVGIWVPTRMLVRLHKKLDSVRRRYEFNTPLREQLKTNLQIRNTYLRYEYRKVSVTYKKYPVQDVRSPAWVAYYLYNGRCSAPPLGRTIIKKKLIICEQGCYVNLAA